MAHGSPGRTPEGGRMLRAQRQTDENHRRIHTPASAASQSGLPRTDAVAGARRVDLSGGRVLPHRLLTPGGIYSVLADLVRERPPSHPRSCERSPQTTQRSIAGLLHHHATNSATFPPRRAMKSKQSRQPAGAEPGRESRSARILHRRSRRLGGRPRGLHRVLQRLPVDTGFGFVLVQHLDPQHESILQRGAGQGRPAWQRLDTAFMKVQAVPMG